MGGRAKSKESGAINDRLSEYMNPSLRRDPSDEGKGTVLKPCDIRVIPCPAAINEIDADRNNPEGPGRVAARTPPGTCRSRATGHDSEP